jgi:hypothetical protein
MRTYSCGTETNFPIATLLFVFVRVAFVACGNCVVDEINYTFLTSENQ